MRIFFDECVSPKLVRALREIEDLPSRQLVPRKEKFSGTENKLDEDWIRVLGEEGDWVIVSADLAIPRGGVTKLAWKQANLTSYFLAGDFAGRPRWTQAHELVRWFPILLEHLKTAPPGSGWRLPFLGKEPKAIVF